MKLKQTLIGIAPVLGSLVGGPLGGAALQMVSLVLLNKPNAEPQDLEKALVNINAAELIQLKKIDGQYKNQLLGLQLDAQRLNLEEKESARKHALTSQDQVPAVLAILMTLGFFITLGAMMFIPLPVQESATSIMDVMLGSLGTTWILCIGYYFGANYRQRRNGNGYKF